MQAGGQAEVVLSSSRHAIADAGIRGVRNRPRYIGKIRLRVGATAGRGLSDEGGKLL